MRNLLFLLAFLPLFSLSAQNSVRFEVKDIPEGASSYMGIRGSNAPLSWEKTYFLQKSDSNTYFALLQFPANLESLEYKFVIDDKKEVVWERLMNRRATLTKSSEFHFLSSWNTEDFIDPSTLPKLSVQELQEDFAVVREVIQQVHPGLYRYNDSASIQASLLALEAAFQKPRTYEEAYLSFAKFAASINCDHTHASLWNQEAIINSIIHRQADKLPVSFSWVGERMIINRHCIDGADLQSGTEVLSINGVGVGEILNRMLLYLPSDGGLVGNKISKAEVDAYLFRYNSFDALYPLLFPLEKEVEIMYRDKGVGKSLTFPLVTREERARKMLEKYPDFPQNPGDLWEYKMLPNAVAYLKIGSFDTDNFNKDWKAMLRDAFKLFEREKAQDLILDIRENQGGMDEPGEVLIKYLLKENCSSETLVGKTRFLLFPEAAKAHIKTWNYWFYDLSEENHYQEGVYYVFPDEQDELNLKRSGKAFGGNLYLLTSPQNVSGAYYLSKIFRDCGAGTIIGQETGGNLNGVNGGSILFLKPPNSRINIDLPVMGLFSRETQANSGLKPDILVSPSVIAMQENRDEVLEKTLDVIKKRRKK